MRAPSPLRIIEPTLTTNDLILSSLSTSTSPLPPSLSLSHILPSSDCILAKVLLDALSTNFLA